MRRARLTQTQLALLEHLAAVAVEQKAEARRTKKKFKAGWTYVKTSKNIKSATIVRLVALGLVEATRHRHTNFTYFQAPRYGVTLPSLSLRFLHGQVKTRAN